MSQATKANPTDGEMRSRVAWVTGGARGIGAATARKLASQGITTVISDILPTQPIVDEITAAGGSASGNTLDIRDADRCQATVETLTQRYGQLDMLVCNAGICPAGNIMDAQDQWNHVLDVNLNGTQNCIRAAWPVMESQRRGCMVLVSSMAYYQGGVIVGPEYTASKAALIGLTRHLARNGGPLGIRCNAVAPGIIDTDMTREFSKPDPAQIPLQRLGSAEDVAGPIAFLCGADSAYMTGTVLNVTGGMILAD